MFLLNFFYLFIYIISFRKLAIKSSIYWRSSIIGNRTVRTTQWLLRNFISVLLKNEVNRDLHGIYRIKSTEWLTSCLSYFTVVRRYASPSDVVSYRVRRKSWSLISSWENLVMILQSWDSVMELICLDSGKLGMGRNKAKVILFWLLSSSKYIFVLNVIAVCSSEKNVLISGSISCSTVLLQLSRQFCHLYCGWQLGFWQFGKEKFGILRRWERCLYLYLHIFLLFAFFVAVTFYCHRQKL